MKAQGFVLLVVVGMLAVLLSVAIGFLSFTRAEVNSVSALRDKMDCIDLIQSATDYTIANISNDLLTSTASGGVYKDDPQGSGYISSCYDKSASVNWWYTPCEQGLSNRIGAKNLPQKANNYGPGPNYTGGPVNVATVKAHAPSVYSPLNTSVQTQTDEAQWMYMPGDFLDYGASIRARVMVQVLDTNAFLNINTWNLNCANTQCQMAHMIMDLEDRTDTELARYLSAEYPVPMFSWPLQPVKINPPPQQQQSMFVMQGGRPLRYQECWCLASRTMRAGFAAWFMDNNNLYPGSYQPWTGAAAPPYDGGKGPAGPSVRTTNTCYNNCTRQFHFDVLDSFRACEFRFLTAGTPLSSGGGFGEPFSTDYPKCRDIAGYHCYSPLCASAFWCSYVDPVTGRPPINVNTIYSSGENIPIDPSKTIANANNNYNDPGCGIISYSPSNVLEAVFNLESLRAIVKIGNFHYKLLSNDGKRYDKYINADLFTNWDTGRDNNGLNHMLLFNAYKPTPMPSAGSDSPPAGQNWTPYPRHPWNLVQTDINVLTSGPGPGSTGSPSSERENIRIKINSLRTRLACMYQETLVRYFCGRYGRSSTGQVCPILNYEALKYPELNIPELATYPQAYSTYCTDVSNVKYFCPVSDRSQVRFPAGVTQFRQWVFADLAAMATNNNANTTWYNVNYNGNGAIATPNAYPDGQLSVSFDGQDHCEITPGKLDCRTANAIYDNIVPGSPAKVPAPNFALQNQLPSVQGSYYKQDDVSYPLAQLNLAQVARDEGSNGQGFSPSANSILPFDQAIQYSKATDPSIWQNWVPQPVQDMYNQLGTVPVHVSQDTGNWIYNPNYKMSNACAGQPWSGAQISSIPYRQQAFGPDFFSTELTTASTTFLLVVNAEIVDTTQANGSATPDNMLTSITPVRVFAHQQRLLIVEICPQLDDTTKLQPFYIPPATQQPSPGFAPGGLNYYAWNMPALNKSTQSVMDASTVNNKTHLCAPITALGSAADYTDYRGLVQPGDGSAVPYPQYDMNSKSNTQPNTQNPNMRQRNVIIRAVYDVNQELDM